MRKALAITLMAGAMTLTLGTAANAVTVTTPGGSVSCVTYSSGTTTAGTGGVSHSGDNVSVAPLGTCV